MHADHKYYFVYLAPTIRISTSNLAPPEYGFDWASLFSKANSETSKGFSFNLWMVIHSVQHSVDTVYIN